MSYFSVRAGAYIRASLYVPLSFYRIAFSREAPLPASKPPSTRARSRGCFPFTLTGPAVTLQPVPFPRGHSSDNPRVPPRLPLSRPPPRLSPIRPYVNRTLRSPPAIPLKITRKHPNYRALPEGGLHRQFRAAPHKPSATFFIEKHHLW